MGVEQLRWQCCRRHQQNPQPCPDSVDLAREEKKEEHAKPRNNPFKNYRRDIAETPAKCPLYGRDKAAEWAGTAVFGLYIHMYI